MWLCCSRWMLHSHTNEEPASNLQWQPHAGVCHTVMNLTLLHELLFKRYLSYWRFSSFLPPVIFLHPFSLSSLCTFVFIYWQFMFVVFTNNHSYSIKFNFYLQSMSGHDTSLLYLLQVFLRYNPMISNLGVGTPTTWLQDKYEGLWDD